MSGTLTVKELIIELLDYDMSERVYIGLGLDRPPLSCADISSVASLSTGKGYSFGVMLIPQGHLVEVAK